MSECGTRAGHVAHRTRGEDSCDACREAYAAYFTEYRKVNPDSTERDRSRGRAQQRAMRRLTRQFPKEFLAIMNEELANERGRAAS